MSVKLICVSHTPLMDFCSPPQAVESQVRGVLARLQQEILAYQPDITIVFGPDHFNGFFYDLMPQACIGIHAHAAGDWDMGPGEIATDVAWAKRLAQHLTADGTGIAISHRMIADHGITQPLLLLTGGLQTLPIVPIFLNAAAPPLAPMAYACRIGRLIGEYLREYAADKRVLLLGSGGLSHDPPTPQIETASAEVAEFLIAGRNPSPEARAARQAKVLAVGQALAQQDKNSAGGTLALNPEWDKGLLHSLQTGDVARLQQMSDAEISQQGGKGGHEIRCWAAAFSALQAWGAYQAQTEYYHAIDEWLAGFGIITAQSIENTAVPSAV
ncbi:MAG: 3-carboxyethylcatechol 2,3-dioxygenase [Neisseria sp.]|nr:3-carboxyethylcatechol 2,3-dioxygenase [Neisseria sp.]